MSDLPARGTPRRNKRTEAVPPSEHLESELAALEAMLSIATPSSKPPYAIPHVLVSTHWVDVHKNDDGIRLVEVDVDFNLYEQGHIPGAVGWAWKTQLADQRQRDILSRRAFTHLMRTSGIDNDTTVILYGDSSNWFAAWAFWQMKVYGHIDVRLMDGGRTKWEAEGRPMTRAVPEVPETAYVADAADHAHRAFLPEVRDQVETQAVDLVDVRSPKEFSGEVLAPPGLPESCQRGGHIPGARNIPWSNTVNADGTFKPADELRHLYQKAGITGTRPIITYCRIGERSSHSWFVLKYLLGYESTKHYDGSWTEWGNLVGVEIETGPERAEDGPEATGSVRSDKGRRRKLVIGRRFTLMYRSKGAGTSLYPLLLFCNNGYNSVGSPDRLCRYKPFFIGNRVSLLLTECVSNSTPGLFRSHPSLFPHAGSGRSRAGVCYSASLCPLRSRKTSAPMNVRWRPVRSRVRFRSTW